jgi:hypothetical protein
LGGGRRPSDAWSGQELEVAPGKSWNDGEQRSRGAEQVPEEEEEGRGPRDLVGIFKNLRDSSVM